ncbi:MAG TPA: response regulator [Geobacteraceae bacterium]|nr:response regulator [Geobacteraceae bacterium]
MGKILLIDDDAVFLTILGRYIRDYYPLLEVETCADPLKALAIIKRNKLDLLLLDLEMPALDGAKIFKYATESGVDKNSIVILSGRDADYLHDHFPLGTCLAVLNKFEARQKSVLDMIFSSLQKKSRIKS